MDNVYAFQNDGIDGGDVFLARNVYDYDSAMSMVNNIIKRGVVSTIPRDTEPPAADIYLYESALRITPHVTYGKSIVKILVYMYETAPVYTILYKT